MGRFKIAALLAAAAALAMPFAVDARHHGTHKASVSDSKAETAALIDSAKELQQKLLLGATPPSAEDIDFLERWLTEHIYGADMALGSYLGEAM